MLKSDYNYRSASPQTKEAMADRCHAQGHEWENCCSFMFEIYARCKWCGEKKWDPLQRSPYSVDDSGNLVRGYDWEYVQRRGAGIRRFDCILLAMAVAGSLFAGIGAIVWLWWILWELRTTR